MKMKKTLLLAAALACSGAVKAETYVCTSTYGKLIIEESTLNIDSSGATWIVDNNEGFRWPYLDGTSGVYQGECEELTEANLTCSYSSASAVQTILINRKKLDFTASTLSEGGRVYSGKCVVI
jgi:hypothetical protein